MSKKDLIEQNITRVQEYVRELIEDAKWNNGVSETLESTSIIVGNSDDIYDYSSHTIDVYYTSLRKYFEYANELNMDNCRRFIKSLEEEKLSPATIRLRITAIEKFSKWVKKPIELKRPRMKRKLDVNNVPTEEEYNRLLEYLKTKLNKDYYFFIKV